MWPDLENQEINGTVYYSGGNWSMKSQLINLTLFIIQLNLIIISTSSIWSFLLLNVNYDNFAQLKSIMTDFKCFELMKDIIAGMLHH